MKPRILVVEDDEAIARQLYWTLSGPYEVLIANDMQTAIRRAMLYEPDVSVLDLHLPPDRESPDVGLRIIEYIKAHRPESKVLVISSANGIDTQKACFALGADEFLDKPFETEQLLVAMRRIAPAQRVELA
ncbi:MAG TPA: response regulator [Pyrinomonadaceae bacterium]|nr:response regulator [Pyrinomonadaceae bacterium]